MTYTEMTIMQLEKILHLPDNLLTGNSWFAATATILLFVFIAILFDWFVKVVVKGITDRTNNNIDNQIVGHLHKPIFWWAILTGIALSLRHFDVGKQMLLRFDSSMLTILLIMWTFAVIRISRIILRTLSNRSKATGMIRPQTLPLFENLSLLLIFIVATYLLFNAWQIDLTAWIASAGIAGIAIGFAAKDTLANLFSGVFILADAPYKVGDTVVLESGERGEITHIGLRSTRMYTTDHAEITLPNALMGNSKVINHSGGLHKRTRIRVPIGVAYGSDIDQVREVLINIANENEDICGYPETRVRFRQFGASSLDLELLFWIDYPEARGRIIDAVNTSIYKTFNELGIEIPYTKQDVYIKEMPGR